MNFVTPQAPQKSEKVSRRRYERALTSCKAAETLLEVESREVWDANQKLKEQAASLELAVEERTKELRKQQRAAEDANQAKTIFLASMSHEIRTPLNGVLGMAEAMQDTALNADQQDMTKTILDSGRVLLAVLNDILDISKIESGQLEIEKAVFDLADLFEGVAKLFSFKAEEKDISLTLTISDAARRWIIGDAQRIKQIASNLLSNAIKFTATGGVSIDVDLLENNGQRLRFSITDTGEGVPTDKLDRLFKPFSQVDSSVSRRHGGTGLGLSISQQFCQLMGGEIVVSSEHGKGSTFTAELGVELGDMPKQKVESNDADLAVLHGNKWRVLLAEDNRTNRMVIAKFLGAFDLDFTIVENGKDAVEAFQHHEFDLILMDVNMPEMDGITATEIIRADEDARGAKPTPIIALTANTLDHQVKQYIASGVDSHLGKPFNKNELILTIRRQLQDKLGGI